MTDVVWIASFPRSGVTYLRHVLHEVFGIQTYTRYIDEPESVVGLPDMDKNWPGNADSGSSPCFVKTHELMDVGSPHPAIYVVRDGRDVYVSLAHYLADVKKEAGSPDQLMNNAMRQMNASWSAHVLAWINRPDTAVVEFEDLIYKPVETVENALARIGQDRERKTGWQIKSFDELHQRAPDFFRAGGRGTWRYVMDSESQDVFNRLHSMGLRGMDALSVEMGTLHSYSST